MVKNVKFFIPFLCLLLISFCLWKGLSVKPYIYKEINKNNNLNFTINTTNSTPINNNELNTLYLFKNIEQEKMFKELISELRCIICQNQNLTESQSDLAINIKTKIYKDITLGKNKNDILSDIVNNYGEFILYRPQFNAGTLILWFGPIFLLLFGLFWFWKKIIIKI